jgi:hypothetical protein
LTASCESRTLRTMARALPLLLIGFVLTASACGSHANATAREGTIAIRDGVPESSLREGVAGIGIGSTASDVRSVFGRPWTKTAWSSAGRRGTCFVYHASQSGDTFIDALVFCLDSRQSVKRIYVGHDNMSPPGSG